MIAEDGSVLVGLVWTDLHSEVMVTILDFEPCKIRFHKVHISFFLSMNNRRKEWKCVNYGDKEEASLLLGFFLSILARPWSFIE